MLTKVYLTMTNDEWVALVSAAGRNCRDPKQEARHLLRVGLGLVAGTDAAPVTPTAGGSRAPAAAEAAVAA